MRNVTGREGQLPAYGALSVIRGLLAPGEDGHPRTQRFCHYMQQCDVLNVSSSPVEILALTVTVCGRRSNHRVRREARAKRDQPAIVVTHNLQSVAP